MSKRFALLVLATGLVGLVGAFPRAGAQVPFPGPADFAGYSTGTAVHTDALQAGLTGPQVANVEEAFSGASVASQGTSTINNPANQPLPPPATNRGMGASPRQVGKINNEMGQNVQPTLPGTDPKLPGDRSFARGSGLEIGLGNNVPANSNPIPVNKVAVSAPPPNSDLKEVGPIKGHPLVFASLLRGQASADWNNDRCILGKPISEGLGYAADAQLLNSASAALPNGSFQTPLLATDTPTRAVAQSLSRTQLVAPTTSDQKLIPNPIGAGLMAETRQTLAPVTIGKGTPSEVTIEVGGEWVLQAVAGGVPGSAYVRYAPDKFPSPTTPLLRILQPNATDPASRVTKILNFQDLFGPTALPIPLIDIPGVLRITIGENPRPIDSDGLGKPPGAPADPNGLFAQGAVDVVRVQVLDQPAMGIHAADIRIGHMEAQVRVPAGGIQCRAGVAKDSDPRTVTAGGQFTYNIDISNPYRDCTLTNVRLTDTISASEGITHSIVSTDPLANSISPPAGADVGQRTLAWNDVGPIPPNSSKRVRIVVRVSSQSRSGSFTDTVVREGQCAGIPLGRETVTVNVPAVNGTNPTSTFFPPRTSVPFYPPPRMRPPLIIPPPPLPILPAQPRVLRTDIVRPALPFTGTNSVPLAATAALLLAFGGWLMMSSRRFGGPALAFGGSGPSDGGPALFQSSPDIGLGGGGVAAPARPSEGHDTSLLEELGIDLTDVELDELFAEAVTPAEPVHFSVMPPPEIGVAAPSLLSTTWPEVDPSAPPAFFQPPAPVEPVHGFVVDSTGVAQETTFEPPLSSLAIPLFEPEPSPEPEPRRAEDVDRDSLSLHVALHWATAPRVAEPETWPEPVVPEVSVPATPAALPLLFDSPAPAVPPVTPPVSLPAPLDVDVSRPPAGLPNLRHAMFLGGAALALCTIKVLKNHYKK